MLWTILRPVAFYDNIMPGFIGRSYAAMLRQLGDRSIAMVRTQDIGNVAARAFNEPGEYGMKEFSLVGEQLTFQMIQRTFRDVVGCDIPETYGLLVTVLRFVEDGEYSWDCTDLVKKQCLLDFETWLKDESKFCKNGSIT
ncbi:NmrA-like family domain-containing protein 1 [Penicillium cf. griseofulvum]|uniref:NmrA-like family domain-containing protein 1 n=1 Tax=Penicillium cf. griseofulvum TaxID=2972120 RepID=A0A9W9IUU1_9EURO|nr:NmrA-like family domain-containing protein 1 [Penicillium cf. griseofulvum]KAJ5430462.1 NmrA-like family domain-containing protein 1 [Penicillium cf. griseofulvum]